MGLPGSEDSLTIGWAVSTQYQRVTDRRTDRRSGYINNVRSMTEARFPFKRRNARNVLRKKKYASKIKSAQEMQ